MTALLRRPAAKGPVVQPVEVRPSPTPRDKGLLDPSRVSPAADRRVRRAVKIRRSLPIRAYVGPNGHGKSLAAVNDLLPSLDRGRKVLSTVPLLDWRADPADNPAFVLDPDLGPKDRRGRPCGIYVHRDSGAAWIRPNHPAYVRLNSWAQLVEADFCDVFLDEVAGVASSRQSSGMPAAIEQLLQKLRKGDITLSWTAPAWARADLIIREATQAVTICNGYAPEKSEHEDRLWKRNTMFKWRTYDANAYTDWSEGKREKAKELTSQRFRGPGSDAFNAYDSLGAVDTIVSVSDAGRCVHCGGTRTAPKCSCDDYLERQAHSAAAAAAKRGRAAAAPGDRQVLTSITPRTGGRR